MKSPGEQKTTVKVAGYLEKKSKMRVMSRWKKQWFVLEGRLLLYYKSQLEYLSLSPCRGTVNMGLAASVAPGKANEIIVSTRSHTVALRALNRHDHDIWLQALIDAMYQPSTSQNVCCSKPVQHFRYSTGALAESQSTLEGSYGNLNHTMAVPISTTITANVEMNQKVPKKDQSAVIAVHSNNQLEDMTETSSNFGTICGAPTPNRLLNSKNYKLDKVDRMEKKLTKLAVSDSSIPGRFRVLSVDNDSSIRRPLRRSASVENEFFHFSENIYESVKDGVYNDCMDAGPPSIKALERLRRSDSDCISMNYKGKMFKNSYNPDKIHESRSVISKDIKYLPEFSSDNIVYSGKNRNNHLSSIAELNKFKFTKDYNKVIKSDTELSRNDFACDRNNPIWIMKERLMKVKENEPHNSLVSESDSTTANVNIVPFTNKETPVKARRTGSFLKRFSRDDKWRHSENTACSQHTGKKRSVSFLRKLWKRREKRENQIDDNDIEEIKINYEPSTVLIRHHLKQDPSDIYGYNKDDRNENYEQPNLPPPDYDEVNLSTGEESDQEPPELPPRQYITSKSLKASLSDIPEASINTIQDSNNIIIHVKGSREMDSIEDEKPPPLPVKVKRQNSTNECENNYYVKKRVRQRVPSENTCRNNNNNYFINYFDSSPPLRLKIRQHYNHLEDIEMKSKHRKYIYVDSCNDDDCFNSSPPARLKVRQHYNAQFHLQDPSNFSNETFDILPQTLPVKHRKHQNFKNKYQNSDFVLHEDSDSDPNGLKRLFWEDYNPYTTEKNCKNSKNIDKLDEMLTKLSEINETPLNSTKCRSSNSSKSQSNSSNNDEDEPDYDIPQPHAALQLAISLRKQNSFQEKHYTSTQYDDSLDPKPLRGSYDDLNMAPDSLECDPWSISVDQSQNDSWATYGPLNNRTNLITLAQLTTHDTSIYDDSLNHKDDFLIVQKEGGFVKMLG